MWGTRQESEGSKKKKAARVYPLPPSCLRSETFSDDGRDAKGRQSW
jgi:hypothetical protein